MWKWAANTSMGRSTSKRVAVAKSHMLVEHWGSMKHLSKH